MLFSLTIFSCQKEQQAEGSIYFFTSVYNDTLKIDTTVAGKLSTTKSFKIFNHNEGLLKLDDVRIPGNNSAFRMNISGMQGNSFQNIAISPKDSMYVFVNFRAPFVLNDYAIITDSIEFKFNKQTKKLILSAVVEK